MNDHNLLANLNPSQHAAVTSVATTLAILAGPGSGKTHTLTSRTAWLLAQGLQPWNVIVATFTVKAAREMKERIGKLIGNGLESKLILGTFHSIARRYLARYGHLIGIKKDFGIADSADSIAIIKRIVKRSDYMIDPKVARSRISGCKARGAGYADAERKASLKSIEAQEFEKVYNEYEEALKRSNMLDYDDLLLRCVELLRSHPSCVSNVEAVLIDEFQDTNLVQFDLMRLFAAEQKEKRITIVGDPDQSIYGFRAAEVRNYKRMLRQYPDTVTIALEENYRSSGAILLSALNVIKQDSSRVDKSLLATHSVGTRPVLRKLSTAYKEAEWIVTEIQRCMGLTGNLLDLNDFAILVRSAALSRLIESALGKSGIAYRMVGGLRFYDRVEVKTILDYLRVINQPDNNDAVARIINNPSRRIGDATIKSLLEEADTAKVTLWELVLSSVQGRKTIKTQLRKNNEQGLSEFVNIILTGRKKNSGSESERSTIGGLITHILERTDYETWLKNHHGDSHGARWENVQELINQASDFQDLIQCGYEDEALPNIDGMDQQENDDYLSRFLANVALASEVKSEADEGSTPVAQVTISTIHAAKGLEWPVVFIPATYQGSIPHSRAEDSNEERRLLYVAMTRAKALLYMSCPMNNSQSEKTALSPFLTPQDIVNLLDKRGPSLQPSTVQSMAHILRRACPSSKAIIESSRSLQSIEDDKFPVEGEEEEKDLDMKWNLTQGSQNYTTGQQPPKRRRVEFGRSRSNVESSTEPEWRPTYTTTMAKASTFTSASITAVSGFVSAGSHLQVLNDQSLNNHTQHDDNSPDKAKRKVSAKSKVLEGQGTLFSFLGKPEPPEPPSKHVAQKSIADMQPIYSQASTGIPKNINTPRSIYSDIPAPAIDPSLSNHRLKPNLMGTKPRAPVASLSTTTDHPDQPYSFLSSSPERSKVPSEQQPRPNNVTGAPRPYPPSSSGLTTKPALMPLIRPPSSMHTTSIDAINAGVATKRTLGMRRSVNSGAWGSGNQKIGKFKPPSMKRTFE